jgi:hypothetical protein
VRSCAYHGSHEDARGLMAPARYSLGRVYHQHTGTIQILASSDKLSSMVDGYTKPSLAVGLLHHPLHLGKSRAEPVCLSLSLRAEHRPGKHKDKRSKHEDLRVRRSRLQMDDALFLHLGCLEGKTDQGRIDDGVPEVRMHMIFDDL